MKGRWAYVGGLLDLQRIVDPAEKRATFRQSMTELGRLGAADGPSPLEGLSPDALAKGVGAALAGGFMDDLDWLAPAAAGVALYTLGAALPSGVEQREVGRRVLARLHGGDAHTFSAMAARMARGGGKGLGSLPVRARISLVAELPIGLAVADGPLALSIVSTRDSARDWIVAPSEGALASRRVAARLLERAAREAAVLALQGETHALRALRADHIEGAWQRLLGDRESLVWRHAAIARGLVAPWHDDAGSLDAVLRAGAGPTEWRRAATAVAARMAVYPIDGLKAAKDVLDLPCIERDAGIATALVWGLARAGELEPERASELLDAIVSRFGLGVVEAITDAAHEYGEAKFLDDARRSMVKALESGAAATDDGEQALRRELLRDLEGDTGVEPALRTRLAAALVAYANEGARAARTRGLALVEQLKVSAQTLEALVPSDGPDEGEAMGRRAAVSLLHDLDLTLLERGALGNLVELGSGESVGASHRDLATVRARIGTWVLEREVSPHALARDAAKKGVPDHVILRMRRLKSLVHLLDADLSGSTGESGTKSDTAEWLSAASAIIDRLAKGPPTVLRRALFASLARALDALVRVEALDVADVVLVCAHAFKDARDFETLAEAAMSPEVRHSMSVYASFCRGELGAQRARGVTATGSVVGSIAPPSLDAPPEPTEAERLALGLAELADELFVGAAGRVDALRAVMAKIARSLLSIARAASLVDLSTTGGSDADTVDALEASLESFRQLSLGSTQRLRASTARSANGESCDPHDDGEASPISVLVDRALGGADDAIGVTPLRASLESLLAGLPSALRDVAGTICSRLSELPARPTHPDLRAIPVAREQLPDWVPPRRTLGGFYVLRPLSKGAVGSVFVVCRIEERNEPAPEVFALKVPDYSATAARLVSESEFLHMFREEASALLSLPAHPNIARFVTFDVAAKPKPILVMEFVEGIALDHVIDTRALTVEKAFDTLDGVLCGLEAMHAAGVGHLDIKPQNVLLRGGETPVLVDFGLAGRKIRPGCGTGPYGAPEVWGLETSPDGASPMPADVYAFACLAFEMLVGEQLFDAPNEMALIAAHLAHDGLPPRLGELASRSELSMFAEVLMSALRRDPALRPSVTSLRRDFRLIRGALERLPWPVVAGMSDVKSA